MIENKIYEHRTDTNLIQFILEKGQVSILSGKHGEGYNHMQMNHEEFIRLVDYLSESADETINPWENVL